MRLLGIKSLWLVLGLMACTDKSGQDTGSGSDSGAAGNTVYTVQEGDWTLAPATIALDECELGSDLASGDEESLTITATSAGFDFLFDGMDAFSCSQEGNVLACEAQTEETDLTSGGTDAVLTLAYILEGSLQSNTRMGLSLSADYSCVGEACDSVAESEGMTLPCTTTLTSTATAD